MKKRKPPIGLPEDIFSKASDYGFLIPYAGKWVIVYDDNVVAAGKTLHEVTTKVSPEIPREASILFKVPAKPERLLVASLQ